MQAYYATKNLMSVYQIGIDFRFKCGALCVVCQCAARWRPGWP